MPKVNGVEYIKYLREQTPGIPIVVITGYPDTEMAVGLMNKGVNDYLVKPVESKKLLEVVNRLVAEGKKLDF